VTLFAYSRPSTTYKVIRTGTATAAGTYAFTIAPTTSTRLYASTIDGASPSAAVLVRTVVSLTAGATSGCGLRARGTVYPHRAGIPVNIEYRLPTGRFRLAMRTTTAANGSYSVARSFTACGTTLVWRATTAQSLVNMAGVSPLRSVTLRR
jgi:hypothetical protein